MGSQAVSFQFSGDVVGGSSLIYSATGRLLKALNSSGVDFYAVASAVQLGKAIPISQERELTISRLLAERYVSRESYLSKALRIGWGHSDLPRELSRTKAGLSALNMIGTFATGSTSLEAAKALSTLMKISGCDSESLPSLDSLKTMIENLSPFVKRSSFDAVIETINLACLKVLQRNNLSRPDALFTPGNGERWAGAVKHLVATSESFEHAHVVVGQRGIWLSAFSSHILGMATKVYIGNIVLWEASGTNGSAHIYILNKYPTLPDLLKPWPLVFKLEEPIVRGGYVRMNDMLPLNRLFEFGLAEILTSELTDNPLTIDALVVDQIHKSIYTFSNFLFNETRMKLTSHGRSSWRLNGNFVKRAQPLHKVLQQMGIEESNRGVVTTLSKSTAEFKRTSTYTDLEIHLSMTLRRYTSRAEPQHILSFVHEETVLEMFRICSETTNTQMARSKTCPCFIILSFMVELSALAVALAQCSCDLETLRINVDLLIDFSGEKGSKTWLDCVEQETQSTWQACFGDIFEYLGRALSCQNLQKSEGYPGNLAWSDGDVSIYIRALIDEDAYDEFGRFMAITSGHMTAEGIRRDRVIDECLFASLYESDRFLEGTTNTFCNQTSFMPYFAQGSISYKASIAINNEAITVRFGLTGSARSQLDIDMAPFGFLRSIEYFLTSCTVVGTECTHDSQREYVVKESHTPLMVHTFGALSSTIGPNSFRTLLFAVAGSPLSQIMQVALIRNKRYPIALQGRSCLDCIISRMSNASEPAVIVMT